MSSKETLENGSSSLQTPEMLEQLRNSEPYKVLVNHEICEALAERICQLISEHKLSMDDFDEPVFQTLRNVDDVSAGLKALVDFEQSPLTQQQNGNNIQFLCELMNKLNTNDSTGNLAYSQDETPSKHSSINNDNQSQNSHLHLSRGELDNRPHNIGPDEEKLKAIISKTG